jgi:hypothetical protein
VSPITSRNPTGHPDTLAVSKHALVNQYHQLMDRNPIIRMGGFGRSPHCRLLRNSLPSLLIRVSFIMDFQCLTFDYGFEVLALNYRGLVSRTVITLN